MSTTDAPDADFRILSHPGATAGPSTATHAVVVDTDTIRLALAVGDEVVAAIPLGPIDAAALARDLLQAACRRSGRPAINPEEIP